MQDDRPHPTPFQNSSFRIQHFPKTHRLSGRGVFKAILDLRVRESRGPITIFAKPNGLPHSRLGISIGRPVGNAARRNRIKRLLRESYRMLQHHLPAGYDLVVLVRPHAPLTLAAYQQSLAAMIPKLHDKWQRCAGS